MNPLSLNPVALALNPGSPRVLDEPDFRMAKAPPKRQLEASSDRAERFESIMKAQAEKASAAKRNERNDPPRPTEKPANSSAESKPAAKGESPRRESSQVDNRADAGAATATGNESSGPSSQAVNSSGEVEKPVEAGATETMKAASESVAGGEPLPLVLDTDTLFAAETTFADPLTMPATLKPVEAATAEMTLTLDGEELDTEDPLQLAVPGAPVLTPQAVPDAAPVAPEVAASVAVGAGLQVPKGRLNEAGEVSSLASLVDDEALAPETLSLLDEGAPLPQGKPLTAAFESAALKLGAQLTPGMTEASGKETALTSATGLGTVARQPDLNVRPTQTLQDYSTSLDSLVGDPDWQEEVSEKVAWFVSRHIRSAEIHLNPAELGPIHVSLTLQQDQAQVSFVSHHPAVRELLEQNVNRLREMLNDNGVNLADVNVSDQNAQGRDTEQQKAQARQNAEASAEHGGDEETVASGTLAVSSDNLIDLKV